MFVLTELLVNRAHSLAIHHFAISYDFQRSFQNQLLLMKEWTAVTPLLGLISTAHTWIQTAAQRNCLSCQSTIGLSYHATMFRCAARKLNL